MVHPGRREADPDWRVIDGNGEVARDAAALYLERAIL